jgi:FkbM family methyltransferase
MRGIRIIISESIRKLLDPLRLGSYAQMGEDRIIESILGLKYEGFYVDVGCHHPIEKSNTYQLYLRGWVGLAIDANPDLVALFRKIRPNDKVFCAAISNRAAKQNFTITKDPALSTLSSKFAEERISPKDVDRKIEVQTKTLNNILGEADAPKRFDLLSIDLEGCDLEAIEGLDLNSYRPRMIVVEMHGFELKFPTKDQIYQYLIQNDYRLHSYVIMNGFFVDNRQE